MKSKWKGALVGGIIGTMMGIIFSILNLGTSYCVEGLNLKNFFCSVSTTFSEFGLLAMIFSIPKLFFVNAFQMSRMGEVVTIPLINFSSILIGGIIGYYVTK